MLTDRSLRIRRGIWVIHETTISFENVQNVEVRQGPVQRHFGIADVIVQTRAAARRAGKGESTSMGAHAGILQGLDDAEAVRDLILRASGARARPAWATNGRSGFARPPRPGQGCRSRTSGCCARSGDGVRRLASS